MQRSNGDVFLSTTLIVKLYEFYDSPVIDILVNEDTLSIAELLPNINQIHKFSYIEKNNNRWLQEKRIIKSIFRNYDLSINLTSSDRSILYALLASSFSISAVEKEYRKSWWKILLLSNSYYFDNNVNILINNLKPLNTLNIDHQRELNSIQVSTNILNSIKNVLRKKNISDFIIFHPSAQYEYKIYPKKLRNELLTFLDNLGMPVIVTGSSNKIDLAIKNTLPNLNNIIDLIGETSIEEYFALSELSRAYVGMDTLNMHIAASQNKPIFAIFGPTNKKMWSPWSNKIRRSSLKDMPIEKYGDITIFQAAMECVACGNAGCSGNGKFSECLNKISPKIIFDSIEDWFEASKI